MKKATLPSIVILFLCLMISSACYPLIPSGLAINSSGKTYVISGFYIYENQTRGNNIPINKKIIDAIQFSESKTLNLGTYSLTSFRLVVDGNPKYLYDKIYKGYINNLNPKETEKNYKELEAVEFPILSKLLKSRPSLEDILYKVVYPVQITIGPEDKIYVAGEDVFRKNYKLAIIDTTDGHPINVIPVSCLRQPQGLAVDKDGNFYVTDYWDDKVKVFNSNGNFVRAFGGHGSKGGQFKAIKAIAVDDKNGFVYVTDNYYPTGLRGGYYDPNQMRVQKFTKDGKFVLKWGSRKYKTFSLWPPNLLYEDELDEPYGITVDSKGNVYVLTNHTPEVRKYTSKGRLIMKWGKYGRAPGEFSAPQAIAIDKDDNVYVADTDNNRIQKFDSNGRFLMEIR